MLLGCRATHLLPLLWAPLFLVLPRAAAAQTEKPAQAAGAASVAGSWSGSWVAPEGYSYAAAMRLEMGADYGVQGQITWTLEQSPRKEERSKIGLTGIEYVRGTFDPASGVLLMEGYEKADPNAILGLDRYRLFLAENGTVIGGITWHHGEWTGLFLVEADR